MNRQLCLLDLVCEKGGQRLFAGLCDSIHAGELLQVAGENGAGKTTLLRILAGLNRDYDGVVQWCGNNIREHWPLYAQDLLYLGHQPALKGALTARENLDWYAARQGIDAGKVGEALAQLGIRQQADLPCNQLSAGQQRRVVLARLMFSTQPLWILDEPFTAIDTRGFAPVVECLHRHLAGGGMVILTTHHGMENLGLAHRTLALAPQGWQAAA